jgi:hypothetical protein
MRQTQPPPNPATQVEPQSTGACVARQAMDFDAYLRWNPEGGLVEWLDWLWQDNPSVMQALIEIVSPDKLIDLIQGTRTP